MIEESNIDSPFFEINKEEITRLIPSELILAGKVTGWCNAYGYELNIEFQDNKFIHFTKVQQSNQDPFLPRNATNRYRLESIFDLPLRGRLLIGGTLLCIFFKQTRKCKNQKIYYQDFPEELLPLICELSEVATLNLLRITKGKFRFVVKRKVKSLSRIIEILNELIKNSTEYKSSSN